MMRAKGVCALVYVIEKKKPTGSPYNEETVLADVPCDVVGLFSDGYYTSRDRSRRESANISIASTYVQSDAGQLRKVVFCGKTYTIQTILADRDRGHRFSLLDCEEDKT